MVRHPTERSFKDKLKDRTLSECYVTVQELSNALAIFGPDLEGVHGKTMRFISEKVETALLHTPKYFYVLHKIIPLNDDVMLVNRVALMSTLSIEIRIF